MGDIKNFVTKVKSSVDGVVNKCIQCSTIFMQKSSTSTACAGLQKHELFLDNADQEQLLKGGSIRSSVKPLLEMRQTKLEQFMTRWLVSYQLLFPL